MKVLREITDWQFPNHTYYLNDSGKLVAYDNILTKAHVEFDKPLFFDKRRRKFEEIK